MSLQSNNPSQHDPSDLRAQARRLLAWFTGQALPYWQVNGIDPDSGGAWESMRQDGLPETEKNRRTMVQARQQFVFSLTHHHGWLGNNELVFAGNHASHKAEKPASNSSCSSTNQSNRGEMPTAIDTATGIHRYLQDHALNPDFPGTYYHSLNAKHQPADTKIDTYDISFNLLALGWLYRITGKPALLTQADTILGTLQNQLAAVNGGFLEGNHPAQLRRQNPHMHLLEAFLTLHEASNQDAALPDSRLQDGDSHGKTLDQESRLQEIEINGKRLDQDPRPQEDGSHGNSPHQDSRPQAGGNQSKWLDEAAKIISLFENHIFDAGNNVLLEYFDDAWQPARLEGQVWVEPGHLMEWVWLLDQYKQVSGFDAMPCMNALYNKVLESGTDPRTGLLLDAINPTGKVIAATKRLWPQTEAIRAHLVMVRLGHAEAEARAAKSIAALFDHYLDGRVPGTWADKVDSANNTLPGPSPASSLYHLATAASEINDFLLA